MSSGFVLIRALFDTEISIRFAPAQSAAHSMAAGAGERQTVHGSPEDFDVFSINGASYPQLADTRSCT